jgi:DNA-binding transcriptional regulator YhcF (GntR family)
MRRVMAIHEDITSYTRNSVLPGLPVGAELPTIREHCVRFDINSVSTVQTAMQPLIDAGYVELRLKPTRRWVVRTPPH